MNRDEFVYQENLFILYMLKHMDDFVGDLTHDQKLKALIKYAGNRLFEKEIPNK